MKAKITLLLSVFFIILCNGILHSQNVGINTTGATPSANAILDLNTGNSNNMGVIIPNVQLTGALTTFNPPMAHAATTMDSGLIVYNTDPTINPIGIYYWSGNAWIDATSNANVVACGSAAANYISYFTSPTTICKSVIYQSSTTTVGVGTTTPQNMLDVNGQMAIGTYAGTVNAAAGISTIMSGAEGIGTSAPKSELDVKGGITVGAGASYAGVTAAPANGMIVEGQVSIGNTNPGAKAILNLLNPGTALGFQLPQLTTAEVTALGAITAADEGLEVYNTSLHCVEVVENGAWTSLSGNLHGNETYTGSFSVQSFIVPPCVTSVTVTVKGAAGSQNTIFGGTGGKGAVVTGTLTVIPGEDLKIIAGYIGGADYDGAGGGGGSFVWDANTGVLKAAAGGGGGAGYDVNTGVAYNGKNGSTTTAPNNPSNGGAGGSNCTCPGGGGGAGTSFAGNSCNGGGGGGWAGDGVSAYNTPHDGIGGNAILNGGAGGDPGTSAGGYLGGQGGFGGGGGSGDDPSAMGGGGGGGGYEGGGGGTGVVGGNQHEGGGGSSYTAGLTGVTTSATNTGNGFVSITW
jgi:hypothetical protein